MREPNPTDQLRRLDNLVRFGTIEKVDLTLAKAQVRSGEIVTAFLPWLTFRTGTSQTWSAPTVGEQCVVLSVSGELTTGVILLGLYSQNAPSQSADEHLFHFSDGAELNYNTASGRLIAKNCKVVIVQASETIELHTPLVKASGNVEIGGNLSVNGTASAKSLNTSGDVKAGAISLQNHIHGSSPKPS